jgi:hypothetical protein
MALRHRVENYGFSIKIWQCGNPANMIVSFFKFFKFLQASKKSAIW